MGQTGPFITLWWVLMKVGSGAAVAAASAAMREEK